MTTPHPSYVRLLEAASRKGVTTGADLARKLNVSQQVINNWRARGVSAQGLNDVQRELGISSTWVSDAKEPVFLPSGGEGKKVVADNGDDPPGGLIYIKEYKIKFSAGPGRVASYDEVTDSTPVSYRESWLRREGIKPDKCVRFKVDGDSMESLLYAGDSVLVNTAEREIVNGGVYAIRYGNDLRIKRIYKLLNGGLILRSDNPNFHPQNEELSPDEVNEHISVIGRVRDKSGKGGL